jgi:glutamate receptor, ionotropic, invertebrate
MAKGGIFVVLLCGLAIAVLIAILEFCHNSKKQLQNDPYPFINTRQSLCSEMMEELCFTLQCRGSQQRPALKRKCSKCNASNTIYVSSIEAQCHEQMEHQSLPRELSNDSQCC